MTGEDEPVQHCTVSEPADLRTALETAVIEFLDVDDQRMIVIYQQAILMVIVTKGQTTAAREFDVELWKDPPYDPTRDSNDLLTGFINELLATTNTTRI